jgi:glucan phosphoethanolaminetransferase (alkaline phosphatase superfamily)
MFFFHVLLYPVFRQFFGIASLDSLGNEHFYVFNVLPFGLATAGFVITRLTKPVQAFLHSKGIRFSIYIDDGRIPSSSLQ